MGRKKRWSENINLTLPEGAKARMDAALQENEDRLDLIRTAIERELKLRGHDPSLMVMSGLRSFSRKSSKYSR
jgi:hypothetical protein